MVEGIKRVKIIDFKDTEKFSTSFEIDSFRKESLIEGLDDIDLSFRMEEEINKFESLRVPRW